MAEDYFYKIIGLTDCQSWHICLLRCFSVSASNRIYRQPGSHQVCQEYVFRIPEHCQEIFFEGSVLIFFIMRTIVPVFHVLLFFFLQFYLIHYWKGVIFPFHDNISGSVFKYSFPCCLFFSLKMRGLHHKQILL